MQFPTTKCTVGCGTSVIWALPKRNRTTESAQRWGCLAGPLVGWYFLQTSPGVPSHPAWFSLTFKGSNSALPTYGCRWAQSQPSGAHHSNRFIITSLLGGRAFISRSWCLIKGNRCKAQKSSKNRENSAAGHSSTRPSYFHEAAMMIMMHLKSRTFTTFQPTSLMGMCRAFCGLRILQLVLFQSAAFISCLITCKFRWHCRIAIIIISFSIILWWRSSVYSESRDKRLKKNKTKPRHNYHSGEYNMNYLLYTWIFFSLHFYWSRTQGKERTVLKV